MGETTKPHRRFEVEIRISGDSWPDVVSEARRLLEHVPEHGPNCDLVSGGYSTGSWVRVTEDQAQTHDRFVEQLDAYLALKKGEISGG